jgi:CYTH domain-containing protein/CHAD domain-containing protein
LALFRSDAWRAMSDRHMTEIPSNEERSELAHDAPAGVAPSITEIEQLMATVRQQLAELAASVRGDLEALRRLASEPLPRPKTSVLAAPSHGSEARTGGQADPLSNEPGPKPVRASGDVSDSDPHVEVERKFIVGELPPELERVASEPIAQGYVTIGEGGFEVRLRRRAANTMLTVKKGLGWTRREEEIPLEPQQFERLWPLTEGRRVEKVRHLIPTDDGLTIELDTYAKELDGLATAEVEFDSEARAEAFAPPPWFGPEVTDDPRYRNARLARDGAPPPPRRAPEPFCLGPAEPATTGIRRVIRGQVDAAIDDLGAGALEDPGEAVHAARKHFKRVRAAARLVRPGLDADAYRLENAAFRDFGRRLSGARDSQVLLETLDALCERYAAEVPVGAFARLRAALVEDQRASEQQLQDSGSARAPIIAELRAARSRVAVWSLEQDDATALALGFERIYRRARSAYLAARKDPTDERLHELRKRTKDLWHAAQILRPTAQKKMSALASRAHRLSDLVGDDHDLAVLAQQADQRAERPADEREAALLQALIRRRRRQIQSEAVARGARIFAAKPTKLAKQIRQARAGTLANATSQAG